MALACEVHNDSILEIVGHPDSSISFMSITYSWEFFCMSLLGEEHDDIHSGRLGTCQSIRFSQDNEAFELFLEVRNLIINIK